MNVYDDQIIVWDTKENADDRARDGRIARVKVEFEEGQFDD